MEQIMQCLVCHGSAEKVFDALVLQKYTVGYFRCVRCGFIQTEQPYWLEESYRQPINTADTGIIARNIDFRETTAILLYYFFKKDGTFLDYAGGFGIFTRLMRDIGFDFYWHDPMTENLLARGFELQEPVPPVELLTTFESFEHFVDPMSELEKMTALSKNILFSTCLLPSPVPGKEWWYYQFEHGQHIAFYSKESLEFLANKYGLRFYSYGPLHLFTEKKFPRSILRWIYRLRKFGFYKRVVRSMTSKTFTDFEVMLKRETH